QPSRAVLRGDGTRRRRAAPRPRTGGSGDGRPLFGAGAARPGHGGGGTRAVGDAARRSRAPRLRARRASSGQHARDRLPERRRQLLRNRDGRGDPLRQSRPRPARPAPSVSPSVAQLDPFIKLAFDRRADRLELGTGAPVTITVGTASQTVSRTALTEPQLLALLREIAPDGMSAAVVPGASVRFAYGSPSGPVEV